MNNDRSVTNDKDIETEIKAKCSKSKKKKSSSNSKKSNNDENEVVAPVFLKSKYVFHLLCYGNFTIITSMQSSIHTYMYFVFFS